MTAEALGLSWYEVETDNALYIKNQMKSPKSTGKLRLSSSPNTSIA